MNNKERRTKVAGLLSGLRSAINYANKIRIIYWYDKINESEIDFSEIDIDQRDEYDQLVEEGNGIVLED